MATITLRGYLEQLGTLLEQEALEEVIGHCRHILQYFPKNLDTYRLLGRALLEKARYDEAVQVFPRVLSAVPSDFVSHVGMSQIYEYRGDFKRALWHMERAYEQMPNNSLVVDQIRSLYEQMGQKGPEKIKMTRAALAKQYADSRMYDQAISELRRALSDSPQRLDLKILLAKTLWQSGYPIESGEMALEILQALPDSLDANKLMAQLWIASKRPEDAQTFLKKVESLAPYESLALIQEATSRKQDISDTAFTLERLDWSAATVGALASESPDWVSKIGDVFDIADGVSLTGTADIETDSSDVSPFEGMDIPDWMSEESGPTEAAAGVNASEDLPDWFAAGADIGDRPQTGELSATEDWFNEMSTEVSQTGELQSPEDVMPTDSEQEETGFTGILDEIDEENAEELDDLRAATAAPSEEEIAALLAQARGEDIEEDTPDWMTPDSEQPEWGDEFTPDWFTKDEEEEDAARPIALDDEMEDGEALGEGVSDSEFDAMFGEDDSDFSTLVSEPRDEGDIEFEALFGADEDSDLSDVDLGSLGDDDLSTLLGEEEPQLDTGWLEGDDSQPDSDTEFAAMFDEGGGLSLESVSDESADDDLSTLLGDEEPQLDADFASMFDEGGELSLEGVSDESADDDLSTLLGDEEPQLDADFASMFDEGGELSFEGVSDESADDDLSTLLGDEQPQLDTSWLQGTDVQPEAAGEADDFAAMFDEGGELSLEGISDESADDDLSTLLGEAEPQLDTSWLQSTDVQPEEEGEADDFAAMFDEGGELSFESISDESADDDLSTLLGEEEPAGAIETGESLPDDYWLTGEGEEAEEEEGDLSALFESDASGMTGFLADAAIDLIDEGEDAGEDDFDSLFEDEEIGDTSWMGESGGDDELVQVAEDIAAEPLKDTGELPEWLSVAPQEEVEEAETIVEPEGEDDFDSLFTQEGLADTDFFTETEVDEEEFEEEEEAFDLNNLFRSGPAIQEPEEELSDIDMLLQETDVTSMASLQQAPDEDLFFAEEDDADEVLADLLTEDEMVEQVDAEVSAVLSELFDEDDGDAVDIDQPREPVVADVDDDELDDIFSTIQAQPEPEIDLDLFELPEEAVEEDELLADLFAEESADTSDEESLADDEFDVDFDDLLGETVEETSSEDALAAIFDDAEPEMGDMFADESLDIAEVDTVAEVDADLDDLFGISGEETTTEEAEPEFLTAEDEIDDELADIFDDEFSALSEGELPGDHDEFDEEDWPEPELVDEAEAAMEATEERVGDDELFTAITTGSDITEVVEDTDLTPEVDWVRSIGDEEMDTDFVETVDVSESKPVSTRQFTFASRQPRWMQTAAAASASAAILEDATTDEQDLYPDDDAFDDLLDFEDFEDDDVLDEDDLDDIFSTDWME